MKKKQDKETRYYIDLDLKASKIVKLDYDQRNILAMQREINPFHVRIFITKGQYNKIEKKKIEILNVNSRKKKL